MGAQVGLWRKGGLGTRKRKPAALSPALVPVALGDVPRPSQALLPISLFLNPQMLGIRCIWESSAPSCLWHWVWGGKICRWLEVGRGKDAVFSPPASRVEPSGQTVVAPSLGRGLGDLSAKLFTKQVRKFKKCFSFQTFAFFKYSTVD